MKQTITVTAAFGIVIISVLSALVIGMLIGALDSSAETQTGLTLYLAMFFGQAFLLIPVLYYLKIKNQPYLETLRIRPISLRTAGAAVLVALGTVILAEEINILIGLILPMPDSFLQMEKLLNPQNPLAYFILVITIVFLAPLGEEVLFRGFLQNFLEKAWGDVTRAVLFTSLCFALIHLNPYWVVQIYLLGVILGFTAWSSKSIITSIIFHVIINASSLLAAALGQSFESAILWKGHIFPPLLLFGCVLFGAGFKRLNSKHGGRL
ncbi:MAG: type II CAAX endopeptidase family protein [Candidatus Neomarinimicrobiota bacterium]